MVVDVCVFCNPILDVVSREGPEFFKEYALTAGGYAEFEPAKHKDIYERLNGKSKSGSTPAVIFIPGGAGQNSARVCQILCKQEAANSSGGEASPSTERKVAYFGAVAGSSKADGIDEYATIMQELNQRVGLETFYNVVKNSPVPSGICAVIVHEKSRDRSMVTNLGASVQFAPEFVQKHWKTIEGSKIVHVTGFFSTASLPAMQSLRTRLGTQKVLSFALCAPFIVKTYRAEIQAWLACAELVFGNETEWEEVGNEFQKELGRAGLGEDLPELLRRTCTVMMPSQDRTRIAICTRGNLTTLVAVKEASRQDNAAAVVVHEFATCQVPAEVIVDCSGCGDAFIGGFFFGLLKDRKFLSLLKPHSQSSNGRTGGDGVPLNSLAKAVDWAHHAAAQVLLSDGCQFNGVALPPAKKNVTS